MAVGPGARQFSEAAVETPDVGGDANAIPLAKVAQLLAYHLSLARGLDPDRPSKLTKVVKY